ncbi:MAG: site-specific integrase [Flavobacteriales bacterium]|jgi:integrase/recombinase XerD|nr:site-specific integrase [Flavobacteriales bacterium]
MNCNFQIYLESKGYSYKSINRSLAELDYFKTWCLQNNLESEVLEYKDLIDFLQFLEITAKVKNITKAKYLTSIKHYYSFLCDQGIRESNPTRYIKIKGIKRKQYHTILSKEELEYLYLNYQVFDVKEEIEWCRKRNKVILGFYVFQGIDTTSLKSLNTKNVDLKTGTVHIPNTRKSKERSLKLNPLQMMDLLEYISDIREKILNQYQKETTQLFFSTGSREDIQNVLAKLKKQLSKQDPKFNCFKQIRASRITYWIKTENLRIAQYNAGHAYISSTENYKVHDTDSLALAVENFMPKLG